jgi:LPS export ABC transporter protein LptC
MPGITAHRRSRPGLRPLILAAALAAAGCSIEGGPGVEGPPAGEIPDTVAVGVVHRVHRDGRLSLELSAARAETWNDAQETILSDARFVEFDPDGAAATVGEAGRVVFHADTENAEVSGGVRVRSEQEEGTVTARSLSWDNTTRRLSAPPEETVTLRRDDGTSIAGTGFLGDFRARQLVFSGPVEGTYVRSDDEP